MNDTTITIIQPNPDITEPVVIVEYFKRLQARYRSEAVTTPTEWPMNTVEGRESYKQSQARERFLVEHSLKDAIARAMAKVESMPQGERIDFNALIYGQVQ